MNPTVVAALALVLLAVASAASRAADPLDAWCAGARLPGGLEASPGIFDSLSGAAVVEERRVAVTWSPASAGATNGVAFIEASTGAPGHWASRDWRRQPMQLADGAWRGLVPVASVESPLVYFVRHVADGVTNVSPIRVFRTAASELTVPTWVFTGFLDGFEEGLEGWELTVPGISPTSMSASTNALTGRRALRLEVPAARASVTAGTVRVRGWMLDEFAPVAVRFAARTESGEGRIACALHGNAGTSDVAIYPTRAEFAIGREWRRLEVPMEAFTGLRPGTVDWFTLQFRADSGRALLVDDLELVLR